VIYQLTKEQDQYLIKEFHQMYLEYIYRDYLPEGSLVVSDGIKFPTTLELTPNITCIIFDDAQNPVDVELHIQEIDQLRLTIPYYVLTGLFKYFLTPPTDLRIKFFPFWAVWTSEPFAPLMVMGDHTFSDKPKQYTISCLNGTKWNHRILTYIQLHQRSYFKNMIFSFGNRNVCHDTVNGLYLTQEELDQYSLLPQDVTIDNVGVDVSINHPAYQETYINLVTETNINFNTPMLSEKTFKPLTAGQLFILIAAPGAVKFLRDVGFDTFDDIIDHSYDQILDPRVRINKALEQVDQLIEQDLEIIYNNIKHRLEQNSIYMRSQKFRNQFTLWH
jgi:hypothetical protein